VRHPGSLIVGLLLTSSMLMVFLGVYSLRWRRFTGALTFFLVCLAAAVYSAGYAMELLSVSLDDALFWNRVQYPGLPFISPLWVSFAIQYRGREQHLNLFGWVVLLVIPVITVVIRWVPSLSHLHDAEVTLVSRGPLTVLEIKRGPWYIVNATNIVGGVFYSARPYLSTTTLDRILRHQVRLVIVASLLPLVSLGLLLTNTSPLDLDLGPFSIVVSAFLFLIALLRYRFLDLVPVAHEKVFGWARDPILIINQDGAVVDFNLAATGLFPRLDPR
jgi:hypothetical protein